MEKGINGTPGAAIVVPFTDRRPGAPCGPRSPSFFNWRDFKDWVVGMINRFTVDLTTKADKVSGGTPGNLASIGDGGSLVDSGIRPYTFDTVPTAGSLNPVTSGGIKQAIDAATPGDYDSVKTRLATVEGKIPSQASTQNQLADKAFVNSSIATNTANYIYKTAAGKHVPFDSLAELQGYTGTLTNNDYAFVVGTDATGNTTYTRYKWNGSTEEWAEEYVLNNSSFTAVQWAAINSGITSGLVAKLGALPTAEALAAALAGKASKADATLTPTYSDTPTFSEWVCQPDIVEVYWDDFRNMWQTGPSESTRYSEEAYNPNATNIVFSLEASGGEVTATRTRTDILGYTLGSQTDKPLQPKGDYALKSELPSVPVTSVNNKTGAVALTASDVGAVPLTDEVVYTEAGIRAYYNTRPAASDLGILVGTGSATHTFTTLYSNASISGWKFSEGTRATLLLPFPWASKTENMLALLSDIAVKSVKLNGTALTPDANGAVNVPALPLKGGTMTGSLHVNGSLDVDYTESGVTASIFQVTGSAANPTRFIFYDGTSTRKTIYLGDIATLASPAFTGAPTAPTPTAGDDSTKVATTAFVQNAVAGTTPNLDYVMRVDPETGGIYYTTPDTNA